MTAFEVLVLVGLVIVTGLAVAMLILLVRSPAVRLEPKLEAIERQLSDSIAIVNLAVSGLREEVAKSGSMLREEISTRIEALGTHLQTTLGTIGTQQSEKSDALAAEQTRRFDTFSTTLTDHRSASANDSKALRDEVQSSLLALGRKVAENLESVGTKQTEALAAATTAIRELAAANEQKQEALKAAVEARLETIRNENSKKLEEMRVTVDEKLQGTLEKRLGASFSQVNENLERVYKSVGEMQALATGVGDLKRVLSNVKLRGTWGEGALGSILDDLLTQDQFARNVEVNPGSGQRVEFALKQPGTGEHIIWVPIDSKMPKEDYERLILASEKGDTEAVEQCAKALERCVLKHAADIAGKYICHPHTTEFAVLFLPTEGLFAEVVRRPGLVEKIRAQHRVEVAGPTTLTAYLHVLRSAFKALAIQERSSEVWQVLGAVKTEFDKFGVVLEKVHKKLGEAQNAVEDAHKRRRAMGRKLRDVEALPDSTAQDVLALASVTAEELLEDDSPAAEAAE